MDDPFVKIKSLYTESFRLNGNSPAALLTPKGRQELRFSTLNPFLNLTSLKILDFGCGLGHLYEYLVQSGFKIDYTGVDITPEFIEHCSKKHPEAKYILMDPFESLDTSVKYDIVFSSGVFNLSINSNKINSKDYAYAKIKELYAQTDQLLICDFLSNYVDFKQDGAQHFSVEEISQFCYRNLSRKFQIRHDILPYEFTLLVWKDASIKKPDNVYVSDA